MIHVERNSFKLHGAEMNAILYDFDNLSKCSMLTVLNKRSFSVNLQLRYNIIASTATNTHYALNENYGRAIILVPAKVCRPILAMLVGGRTICKFTVAWSTRPQFWPDDHN